MFGKTRTTTMHYAAKTIDINTQSLFTAHSNPLLNKGLVKPSNNFLTPIDKVPNSRASNAPVAMSARTQPVQSGMKYSFILQKRSSIAEDIGNSKKVIAPQDICQQNQSRQLFEKAVEHSSLADQKQINAKHTYVSNLEIKKSAAVNIGDIEQPHLQMRRHLQQEMKEKYGGIRNFTKEIKSQNNASCTMTVDKNQTSQTSADVAMSSPNESFTVNYGFFTEHQSNLSAQSNTETHQTDSSPQRSQEGLFKIQSDFIDQKFKEAADEITDEMEAKATQDFYKLHNVDVMINQKETYNFQSLNEKVKIVDHQSA